MGAPPLLGAPCAGPCAAPRRMVQVYRPATPKATAGSPKARAGGLGISGARHLAAPLCL